MQPVIDPTQSILGYLQYQTWAFQPAATNTPTSWSCTTLPAGLSFNGTTGLISGSVAVPGVYDFNLRAINADGPSTPVAFCFAIEATGGSSGTDLDLEWDITTRQVRIAGAVNDAADAAAPLFRVRMPDEMIASVRLVKNGVTVDVAATSVTMGATDDAEDAVLVTSGAHHKAGSGDATRYRVPVSFTTPALKGVLEDTAPAADGPLKGVIQRQKVMLLCDLKVVFPNPDAGTFGPANIRLGSDTFLVEATKSIVA